MTEESAQPPEPEILAPECVWVLCKRCGKDVAGVAVRCPYCDAVLRVEDSKPVVQRESSAPWIVGIVAYAALGITTIVAGTFGKHLLDRRGMAQDELRENLHQLVLACEVIDTALVAAFAILVWRREGGLTQDEAGKPLAAWLMVLPVTVVMLACNVGYHAYLVEFLQLPQWMLHEPPKDPTWWPILLMCIQPAVVEEWFFRGSMTRVLRTITGRHAVVWITALMFGMAHIGVPLSIPLLFLLGVSLGYLRWIGASIWPAVAVHLLHNGAIVWWEHFR